MTGHVRLGLIGAGNMGPTWAEAGMHYAPNASVVAVGGGTRAPGLAAQFGFEVEPSVDALLARRDVDAVIVCSPQVTHHQNVLLAAAAGKHILVEKPMALNVAQADEMIAAADAAGVTLGVVSQHRFRRTPVAAKRLIESGAIGTVRMVQVRGITPPWTLPTGNQPWADLGFHLCDILRWLVGSEVTLVSAQFGQFGSDPPQQTAFVIYRFASNALAHVWFSYEITKPGLGSIMQFLVTGSTGMIDLDSYAACRLSRDDGWDVIESTNFRVRHKGTRELADTIARTAEAKRKETFEKWSGPVSGNWDAKCVIVLHPTAADYAKSTGKPAEGTGHALVKLTDGRAAERRIDLRADDPAAVANALPRELTHVVLADLFPDRPPPKWAEEGMAVLAGSPDEVSRFVRTLPRCVQRGEWIALAALVEMKDVPGEKVAGFYCESVSVVDYLVKTGGARNFTIFLRDIHRYGVPGALKRNYQIDGPQALEAVWKRATFDATR